MGLLQFLVRDGRNAGGVGKLGEQSRQHRHGLSYQETWPLLAASN